MADIVDLAQENAVRQSRFNSDSAAWRRREYVMMAESLVETELRKYALLAQEQGDALFATVLDVEVLAAFLAGRKRAMRNKAEVCLKFQAYDAETGDFQPAEGLPPDTAALLANPAQLDAAVAQFDALSLSGALRLIAQASALLASQRN